MLSGILIKSRYLLIRHLGYFIAAVELLIFTVLLFVVTIILCIVFPYKEYIIYILKLSYMIIKSVWSDEEDEF